MHRALQSAVVSHGLTIALGAAGVLFLVTAGLALMYRPVMAYHPNNPPIHLTV